MPLTTDTDRLHLARTLELAAQGRGRVSPNPLVGAVIARDGDVLGEGWHTAYGEPHAEVEALTAAAGADLADATLYVSLEPCCHTGKQPPCTDAIVAAGIRRVVVASDDPTEKASGRGLGILRDEGIAVEVADGELATRAGDSKWISNEASRRRAHRWRAECDAVAVGIGTALADDPQLTARIPDVARQPRRVVFDATARLPLDSQLVAAAPEIPLTVVVSRAAPRSATDALETHGADVIVATGEHEQARVVSALDQLGAGGVSSMLLEGGPRLAGAFFDAGEIDELRLFLAPLVLGGRTARDPLEGEGVETIAEAVRALTLECERVGDDLLVSARLREW
jgi:diaminohydroxyphosphoribosylaminopyrimidine deaminase/5-amino-6-(5-phosphoribosylamino)uracil reductase